jgi:hypothetical protein
MASVTVDTCRTSTTDMSFSYDDVSLLITSVTISNTSPTPVTLTVTLFAPNGTQLFTGSRSFNTGTRVFDIAPLNLHMTQTTNKKGETVFEPPFGIGCSWSNT